jgi:uncharacterized coiled-coil protein SlyX
METSNSNNQAKGEQQKQNQNGFDLSGFDLSGLFAPGAWESIKPLLSSGALSAGLYMLSIKPLKEKVETQEKAIEELEDRLDAQKEFILELEAKLDEMKSSLGAINEDYERKGGLFETKRRPFSGHSTKRTSEPDDYRGRSLNL